MPADSGSDPRAPDPMTTDLDATFAAQAIGLLGLAGGATWPLFPTRAGMLLAQLAAGMCFAVHFLLLGAETAAALNLLSAVQAGIALPLGERPLFRRLYLAMLVPIAAILVFTWTGLPSLFAAGAAAMISIARYQTNVLRFRGVTLLALPLWFVHNAMVGSVPGMISDLAGFAINAVHLVRSLRTGERTA